MYMGAEPCERTQFRVDSMHIELPASSKQARAGDTYHSSASINSQCVSAFYLACKCNTTNTNKDALDAQALCDVHIYSCSLCWSSARVSDASCKLRLQLILTVFTVSL